MKNVFNIFELVGNFDLITNNTKAADSALRKVDPAPHLGSTAELTFLAEVMVS